MQLNPSHHELGCGGVEGWPLRESTPEGTRVRKSAGQAEERTAAETVSGGIVGSCPSKTEAEGWHIIAC